MLKNAFTHLFADRPFSQRMRLVWMLLLILSPVAYLIGVVIIAGTDPNARVGLGINRREAILTASRYAAETFGLDVTRWNTGVRVEVNNDRHYYYRLRRDDEAAVIARLRRFAPETSVNVLFTSPGNKEKLSVWLAPDGRPLGFARTLSPDQEIVNLDEPAARALAAQTFQTLQRERLGDFPAPANPPLLREERKFNGVVRSYDWRWPLAPLPGLDLQAVIKVHGDRVVGQELTSRFDAKFADENFVNRQTPARAALWLYGLLVFFVACYGLYRYIQRSRQKEVPHARSLLLCGITAGIFMFIALQTDFQVFTVTVEQNAPSALIWIILISTMSIFLLLGLALGLAYGSGEGDVREAYPGKLTSLDALITGRIFSRNIARAICIGCAMGGWTLLARALAVLPWINRPDSGPGLADHFFQTFYGSAAWLIPLLSSPLGVVETAVLGLLLPLSFLHRRRLRSQRLLLFVLMLLSFLSSLSVFREQPLPLGAGLLRAAIMTATLLVLFFAFDLLTAVIGLTAPTLVVYVIYLASQPAASLRHAGFIAAGLALTGVAGGMIFLFRGREYREDEVRPLYARHLAERLSLQAEVSAAREAQVRLLPQALPQIPGLGVAAVCLPARVVGGDFYDLFELDDTRLGVFVAEGGSNGLGTALNIAFAKGFLMPRIFAGHSPAEVVCGLQNKLAPMLDQAETMTFAYAVVDVSRRSLTYARIGHYPRVMITNRRRGAGEVNGNGDEHEVRVDAALGPDAKCVIYEATLALEAGDAVVLVTDGIAKSLGDGTGASVDGWVAKVVSGRPHSPNGSLQTSLEKAMKEQTKRARRSAVEDDLTAVVIHLRPSHTD